jgi:tRNA U34 5-carboxymethylaminomethyl modifying GTPase MnmE/TrmE
MSDDLTIFNDTEKLKKSFEKNAGTANDKVEHDLKNNLVISLYGPVNAGKSTLINALFGKKLSEVSLIPFMNCWLMHFDFIIKHSTNLIRRKS